MGSEGPDAQDDMKFDERAGVLYQSFSPLCGPCGDSAHAELISGPLVTRIGAAHNKTGAQVSLKIVHLLMVFLFKTFPLGVDGLLLLNPQVILLLFIL